MSNRFTDYVPKQAPVPLYAHQKESLELYRRSPIVLDTGEPGVGKTRANIAAWLYRRIGGGGKMLVIAPKPLLRTAWGSEFGKVAPNIKIGYCVAGTRQRNNVKQSLRRVAFTEGDPDVVIMNTDGVLWLARHLKLLDGFDTMTVDESGYYRNPTSGRSKALRQVVKHFEYKSMLSGTPTGAGGVSDIWFQVYCLDGGERLGPSHSHFQSNVQIFQRMGADPRMGKWIDKPGVRENVAVLLADISIQHRLEDCADIPANYRITTAYTPSDKLLASYKKLAKTALLQLQEAKVKAVNAAVLRGKLLQVASGAVYAEDGSYEVLDNGRYELIGELIHERKHSVVFYMWKHQLHGLEEELTKRKVSFFSMTSDLSAAVRDQAVDDFQEGRYQTILMHPLTGAHGLTLTKADTTIICSPMDRPDALKQAIHRIVRTGQTKKTTTIFVHALGTIEDKAYANLERGSFGIIELLDALKDNIAKLEKQ